MSAVGLHLLSLPYAVHAPTVPPSSPPVGLLVAALLSGALFGALITAGMNLLLAQRKNRDEERSRVRGAFAAAYRAVAVYKEFPYVIRRRESGRAEDERIRISTALRDIQAELSYFIAWTDAESATVGRAYKDLVAETRRVAGRAMKEAWSAPPLKDDNGMVVPRQVVDLSPISAFEDAYMQAVRSHLANLRSRRIGR